MLQLDAFELANEQRSQLTDKIQAYSEYGCLRVVCMGGLPDRMKLNSSSFDMEPILRMVFPRDQYPMDIASYIQVLAEYETVLDVKRSPTHYSILDQEWWKSPLHAHPSLVLNRINGFSVIAEMLGWCA